MKYRKLLLPLLLLLLTFNTSYADTEKPEYSHQTDIDTIRMLLTSQQDAWNRGDIDAYMQGYWKSAKLRFASGGTYKFGWQKTYDGYKKRYPNKASMGQLHFTLHDINQISANHALVFGTWKLMRQQDSPGGLFTLLLRKTAQGWKIIADHTSSATED